MQERLYIGGIPALLWGEPSDRLYIYVHGKLGRKEVAEPFAGIAGEKGHQTLSFDLPQHGERRDDAQLDVFTGMRELNTVADWVFARWKRVSLYACSIGAYFSLQTYGDRPFKNALFQSPIVDMAYLVGQMMRWFSVTPEELQKKRVIDTPIDPLRWDYYQYIMAHPAERWPIPTAFLYGGRDNLQSPEVMRAFAKRFGAALTVSPDSEHPFMAETDIGIVEAWLREQI